MNDENIGHYGRQRQRDKDRETETKRLRQRLRCQRVEFQIDQLLTNSMIE